MNAFVLIYSPIMSYPPTMSAIQVLSKEIDKVYVFSTKVPENKTLFKKNVHFIEPKNNINKKGLKYRLKDIYRIIKLMNSYSKRIKPKFILIYDPFSSLIFQISKIFISPPLIWYHSHDILDETPSLKNKILNYSENLTIKQSKIFSLPDKDRIKFFKKDTTPIVIPNYPRKELYYNLIKNVKKDYQTKNGIKVIYQGSISNGHGLLDLINYIKETPLNIYLTIIGKSNSYSNYLEKKITQLDLQKKIKILPYVSYEKLPEITANQHVGWAIIAPEISMNYAFCDTGSNKIHEYIICGLPIFICNSNSPEFESMDFVFKTDLSKESLNKNFNTLFKNLKSISEKASNYFDKTEDFDYYFKIALKKII